MLGGGYEVPFISRRVGCWLEGMGWRRLMNAGVPPYGKILEIFP